MKLTKEQLSHIIKEELTKTLKEYGPFGSAMEHSLYDKVKANIQRISHDGSKGLEVRKHVTLLQKLEDSSWDPDEFNNPETAHGVWMDVFMDTMNDTYWDGKQEIDIRFSTPEIEEMCPDCGPIWDQVVKDNGMDGPGYGSEQEPWSDIVDAVKEKNPQYKDFE